MQWCPKIDTAETFSEQLLSNIHRRRQNDFREGMQKVTALWGEQGIAWVAYSDGRIYACSSPKQETRYQRPNCKAARGAP